MFVRGDPPGRLKQLREFFVPSMGYRRTLKYMWYRITRLSDTTYSIAAGLAVGAAISFSPLVGTHFIQALIVAYFMRVNYLASMIGTFWGNPWTFPFMWIAGYQTGSSIFASFGMFEFTGMPENMTMSTMMSAIFEQPLNLFIPWMLGGYICALLFWPIAFTVCYFMVKSAKEARRKRRLAKLKARALIKRNARNGL